MSEKFEKMLQEALKKYYVDVDIFLEKSKKDLNSK